jgi:hypothetical protein
VAAKKKNKSGWNSLSPSQQNEFKAKNFDKNIKVSEATIQGLRAGKTFEGNVAKFKSGATAEQREAMNRFYGKSRVDSALGGTVSGVNKTYPTTPSSPYQGGPGAKPRLPKTTAKPKAPGKGIGSMAGDFVKNELLGVDDFTRSIKYAKQGNVKGAIKSGLTGQAELGLTAATVIGSFFTGGAAGAAVWGAKGAAFAAKQAAKEAAKQGAKATAKGAVTGAAKGTAKGVVKVGKTVATGSVKTGVKNVGSGVKAVGTGAKKVKSVKRPADPRMTAAKNVAARNAAKIADAEAARKTAVVGARASRGVSVAARQNVARAEKSLSAMQAGRKKKVVTPGEVSSARGNLAGTKSTAKAVSKNAASATSRAKKASANARNQKAIAERSANRVKAIQKKKEAAKTRGKNVRRAARRGQYAHFAVATISRDGKK